MKKKSCEQKKNVREAGWGTAHLPVLGNDTGNCIMTQGWGGRHGCATRPGWHAAGRYDMTRRPCDTSGLCVGRAARAHMAWPLGGVSRYKWEYRDKRAAWLLGVSRDKLRHSAQQRCDMAEHAL